MIEDWRRHWGRGEFPFYYVQLAPFRYGGNGVGSALLRDAQRLSLATPNTGMAVVLDIGNPNNIHPLNKHDVGHRLALWALAKTYGQSDLVYSGPLYRGLRRQGDALVVDFDHAEGLHAKGGTPTHFEIAGADGVFTVASAEIVGETVVLSSPEVPVPAQARFAWSDVAEPDLFNGAGLPASSFHSHWNHSQWTQP
jgi:sialate O-acetylesterase